VGAQEKPQKDLWPVHVGNWEQKHTPSHCELPYRNAIRNFPAYYFAPILRRALSNLSAVSTVAVLTKLSPILYMRWNSFLSCFARRNISQ